MEEDLHIVLLRILAGLIARMARTVRAITVGVLIEPVTPMEKSY